MALPTKKYIDGCFDMAKKYEDMLSNTVSYSEVSKINDAAGKEYVTVSDDTLELIKKWHRIRRHK